MQSQMMKSTDVIKYAVKNNLIKYAITNYVINTKINKNFMFPTTAPQLTLNVSCLFYSHLGAYPLRRHLGLFPILVTFFRLLLLENWPNIDWVLDFWDTWPELFPKLGAWHTASPQENNKSKNSLLSFTALFNIWKLKTTEEGWYNFLQTKPRRQKPDRQSDLEMSINK